MPLQMGALQAAAARGAQRQYDQEAQKKEMLTRLGLWGGQELVGGLTKLGEAILDRNRSLDKMEGQYGPMTAAQLGRQVEPPPQEDVDQFRASQQAAQALPYGAYGQTVQPDPQNIPSLAQAIQAQRAPVDRRDMSLREKRRALGVYGAMQQQKKLADALGSSATISEYKFLQDLSPEEKEEFFALKRGITKQNAGDEIIFYDAMGREVHREKRGIPPERTAQHAADVEEARTAPLAKRARILGEIKLADKLQELERRSDLSMREEQEKFELRKELMEYEIANDAERARQRVMAKAEAERQLALPQLEDDTREKIALLNSVLEHPAFEDAIGFPETLSGVFYKLGWAVPGTEVRGFDALIEQVQGQAFMDAFQSLKGGGQITEEEGKRAEAARTRLGDTELPEDEYVKAVNDYIGVLRRGLERRQKGIIVNEDARQQWMNMQRQQGEEALDYYGE